METIKSIYGAKLAPTVAKIFKTLAFLLILSATVFINGCTKENDDRNGGDPTGVWQRYGSTKGYNTDLAIGNIPGEPENRVYMCEHPGSPSAGLYKGTISGNTITWDAKHRLPDAEFKKVGGERTLYFGVGDVADAGKYKKGVWTNTCGALDKPTTEIYYRWSEVLDPSCPVYVYPLTYVYPNLPSVLTKNQFYGPISAGTVAVNRDLKGTSQKQYYVVLSAPKAGFKRYYTNFTLRYYSSVNRCLSTDIASDLSYYDQPL